MRKVAYSLDSVNDFWQNELDDTCEDAKKAYNQCKTNGVITNNDQCYRLSLYNYFQMARTQWAYGWLSYDNDASKKVFDYCSATASSWEMSYEKFKAGLQFNFGYQSSDGKLY